MWPTDVLFGCRNMYTCRTPHCGHCSHRNHHSHCSHCSNRSYCSALHGWVTFRRDEASESLALWNCCPESVGCPDPGFIHNASGTLRPRSYDGSSFNCYLQYICRTWCLDCGRARTHNLLWPICQDDWLITSKSKITRSLYRSCQP